MKLIRALCSLVIFIPFVLMLSDVSVSAYTTGVYGSGGYGSCQYGIACTISITSSGSINLNVIPTSSGKCTIQSDSVGVLTDDTNGYSLSLSDSSTNTSLINGSSSINATTGTFGSPVALVANSWGYRIDSLGSFGSGPTTSQTNAAISSTVFAGVTSSASPVTLANTSAAADPMVTTTVWYGVCANTAVNSGSYSSQVTYTALAN